MTEQEEIDAIERQDEIDKVTLLLQHPCGYGVDQSGVLWVRRYEHPMWAVEWEVDNYLDPKKTRIEVKEFDTPYAAATFFVNKRHEMELGLDYEKEIA